MKIFLSYSHKDELFKQELETHLSLLKRQNLVSVWNDRRIEPGDNWAKEIDNNLVSADLVLILVSADFIASDYCYDIEMKKAFELHQKGELRVIPVILRHCDWHSAPFGSIQGLPKDARPIDSFTRKDEAYLEVAGAIRGFAEKGRQNDTRLSFTAETTDPDDAATSSQSQKRSSNLHVRRKPTDLDKKKFVVEAFVTIAEYVRASAQELSRRNDDVEVIENASDDQLTVSLFSNGKLKSECRVWRASDWGSESIRYSTSNLSNNSWNGEFNIRELDDQLGFTSMHATIFSSDKEFMSADECAEEVWDQIMAPLQR